jgi:hypothetical protein
VIKKEMNSKLKENAHKNTGIGYLMFDEKQIAQGFDYFADHEFKRLIKKKTNKNDRKSLKMNEWTF